MTKGFDRVERAMYMMAASICPQIRSSSEAMQGSIAAAAGQVSAAVGAASIANVNASASETCLCRGRTTRNLGACRTHQPLHRMTPPSAGAVCIGTPSPLAACNQTVA